MWSRCWVAPIAFSREGAKNDIKRQNCCQPNFMSHTRGTGLYTSRPRATCTVLDSKRELLERGVGGPNPYRDEITSPRCMAGECFIRFQTRSRANSVAADSPAALALRLTGSTGCQQVAWCATYGLTHFI